MPPKAKQRKHGGRRGGEGSGVEEVEEEEEAEEAGARVAMMQPGPDLTHTHCTAPFTVQCSAVM